jgi:L-alanine-DL-glutamate epimerase-like enolase superfamily enzyme
MKITDIQCHILVAPDIRADATSSSQDTIVVLVHTDEGITGIGETDTGPWLAQSAINAPSSHTMAMGIKDLLIGQDPFDTSALWEKLYTYTCMSGRRGAVINSMGAIDMALWDIKGKKLGLPCYKLLGGAQKEKITPYASLQPNGNSIDEYRESLVQWVLKAKKYGYTAAKLECTLSGPYRHVGLSGSDENITEIITACREAVGKEFTLMVDVQYLWFDAKSALRTIQKWDDLDIYFLETPLQIDNLEGYALLSQESSIRIAAGEWQTTRFEFYDLIDKGKIDVVQPDVGRVGGLTEAMRVCNYAQDRGRLIVPHCWKTGIGIAATAHLAFAIGHCPFIEFLPAELCDSPLRRELVVDELEFINGHIPLPQKPGLGIEINPDVIKKFSGK